MVQCFMRTVGCVAAACLFAVPARAGVVAPGETRFGTREDHNVWPIPEDSVWKGELLDERSEAFEFVGEPSEFGVPTPFSRGTFTSRVYRDLAGGLAFEYELDETASAGVNDLEGVVIRSFASFATDVYSGDRDHSVTRAADGTSLGYMFNTEGVGGRFVVRTDAAAFDDDGSFSVDMDFEPSGVSRGQTFIAFAPATGDPGPGPTPIPLPPAAWAAIATAAAFGAGGKARRWRRGRTD